MNDTANWEEGAGWGAPVRTEGIDLWTLLVRRKWSIAIVTVVGLALGYLQYLRIPAVYSSTAQLLITEKSSSSLPMQGIESQGTTRSVTDHTAVITSPLIVQRAVTEKNLASLKSLSRSPHPANEIMSGLEATPLDDWGSNVLNLRYEGADSEDCATILNAIMETYQDFLGETHQSVGQETVELITRAKDELLKKLAAQEATYAAFRRQAPLLWKDGEATNLHQERQAQIEEARSAVLLTNTQLRARIQAIGSAMSRGDNQQALLLMANRDGASFSEQGDANGLGLGTVHTLILEEQALADRYGPDYPKLKAVRRRLELAKQLRQLETNTEEGEEGRLSARPEELLATYLQSLREQLQASEQERRELDALFTEEEKAAKTLAEYQVRDAAYSNDIGRTQQLFDAVINRLQEVSLIKDYGGFNIQMLSMAEAGSQIAPKLIKVMAAAGLLGSLAGIALGFVIDKTDSRFHSPREVSSQLQLPLVGHIPVISTSANGHAQGDLASILCTVHRPTSSVAEAYRAVRTALYFNSRGDHHRIIQITSPLPGDGKSTLAANLAVTIANSGKNVLLLDADFRRPTLHKLFGADMESGLATVVSGNCEPLQAVQSTTVENLSLMVCGAKPSNPSELLTSPRFKELLDFLRERYDFVIIDTPPMLAVTDPSAVAARVDGVLLTLRIKKNVRPSAIQARDMLDDLGSEVFGVVVNGVGERTGYGYYTRRYGYRSGSSYGYGQDSNGSDLATYYDADDSVDANTNGHPANKPVGKVSDVEDA